MLLNKFNNSLLREVFLSIDLTQTTCHLVLERV